MIKHWFLKPARFYEFWLPQSGLPGGAIGGALAAIALFILAVAT